MLAGGRADSGLHARSAQQVAANGQDIAAGGRVRASGWFPSEAGPSCTYFGRWAREAQVVGWGSETSGKEASARRVEEQSCAVASPPFGASEVNIEHPSGVSECQSPSTTSCQSCWGCFRAIDSLVLTANPGHRPAHGTERPSGGGGRRCLQEELVGVQGSNQCQGDTGQGLRALA